MKIYTLNFNCSQPSLQRLSIPNFSDVKIGVKVQKADETLPLTADEVTLVAGDKVIKADGITKGFITFTISTGAEGETTAYTLRIKTTVVKKDFELVICSQKSAIIYA